MEVTQLKKEGKKKGNITHETRRNSLLSERHILKDPRLRQITKDCGVLV